MCINGVTQASLHAGSASTHASPGNLRSVLLVFPATDSTFVIFPKKVLHEEYFPVEVLQEEIFPEDLIEKYL